jgi:Putative zinc-finger
MDCNTARMLAELRGSRLNELPAEDAVALDGHLQTCPDCQSLLRMEEKLDAPLIRAMAAIPVPPGLKAKIFDRLATERGAVLRRRLWYSTATAAVLVIAVGILSWNPERKPKLELGDLVVNANQYVDDPKVAADAWLASQGIRYEPPLPFNPHLLAFHGMVSVQGKQVPMLCYRSYEDGFSVSARVYLIRSSDFDLSNLKKNLDGGSWGGQQVEIHPAADQPDQLVYVIIYNSKKPNPFLIQFSTT